MKKRRRGGYRLRDLLRTLQHLSDAALIVSAQGAATKWQNKLARRRGGEARSV